MLGLFDVDHLVGAAILTLPVEPEPPPAVVTLVDQAWRDLGETTRERYQSYADVTSPFFTTIGLHHHLNMLGIRASHAGQGLARPLLEAVHQMSDADPNSAGISLTTERARNVKLYEHFGYKVVAHLQVSDEVETWGLFRNRQTSKPAAT